MKLTLSKIGMAACTALGFFSFSFVESAQAIVITPANPSLINPDTPGPVCDFTGAVSCSGLIDQPTDNLTNLGAFLSELGIDPTPWRDGGFGSLEAFLAKLEAPDTTATEGLLNFLTIEYNGDPEDATSGSYSVEGITTDFILAMKTGNGISFNFFKAGLSPVTGSWDTSRFGVQGGGFSHATLWVPETDSTPIPTPALLPGLVGMGVAALRKRKGEVEESTEA